MSIVYQRSKGLTDAEMHYARLHARRHPQAGGGSLEELNLTGSTVGIAPWFARCLPITTLPAICRKPRTARPAVPQA